MQIHSPAILRCTLNQPKEDPPKLADFYPQLDHSHSEAQNEND